MTIPHIPSAIERIAVEALVPYARNSRTHSDAQVSQLAASLREFGFTNPVLIDEEGVIIAGHGRVMAARQIGLESVPCIRLSHLSESQRRAYVIADNKIALNAGWDEAMLAAELAVLQAEGVDFAMVGFDDDDEVARLLAAPPVEPAGHGRDPDAAPSPRGGGSVSGRRRLAVGKASRAVR